MKTTIVLIQAAILVMLAVAGAQGNDTQRAACPVNQPGAYCDR